MDEATYKATFKPVNIRDLFMDKNPSVGRWIPGFLYRLMSKVLRIDFMNMILYEHGFKKDVDFARASIEVFRVTLEVRGRENLPREGRFIFVSNHPLGGFDGMMLLSELHGTYDRIKVLVNDLLMHVKNMDGVFVPINKHGSQVTEHVRRINELFQSDQQILSFPAGLVSRRRKGVIRDVQWHKSFITKARQTRRDIVPIHVSGRNSNFFYIFANIRKFLGIKTNLEMFFLPNETYRHRNKHFVITIGKPVPWQTFDRRFQALEWAQLVKDHVYKLSNDPGSRFAGMKNQASGILDNK
jgi:putative hemolysin